MQDLTFTKYDVIDDNIKDIHSKYDSIIKFKRSLEKIEMLIGLEDNEEQKQGLQQMKENILEALGQQVSQLKQEQKKKKLFSLSTQTLKEVDIGKLAKCYIVEQGKWKNSEVLEVDEQQQTAKVFQYGKNETVQFPAYKLKVLKTHDPLNFTEGVFCKAIYSGDGQFYPCLIQKVEGQNYHVKYKKYNSKQIVKLHRLRQMKTADAQTNKEFKFQDLDQLKIPQHLKILPNDPQNVKKSKKTKVKAMKFAFKNAQIDEVNKQKQNKWQSFNNTSLGYGHFQTKIQKQAMDKNKQHRLEPSKLVLKPPYKK